MAPRAKAQKFFDFLEILKLIIKSKIFAGTDFLKLKKS
jgi:hypothetical protein